MTPAQLLHTAILDSCTTHSSRGAAYTVGQLRAAFDRHQVGPWKGPQWALVADYAEAQLVADAFEHFHGSEASITLRDDVFVVHSPGYGC